MKKQNINSKRGFTIIEVVLVLAIAGLIFLMVFTALPAMQRSQRDTQRKNDVARLMTAINNYQSNNRGKIPTTPVSGYVTSDGTTSTVKVDGSAETAAGFSTSSWGYLYKNYILVGSGGATDVFDDPAGGPYSLATYSCKKSGIAAGDKCEKGQRNNVLWDDQVEGTAAKIGLASGTAPNSIAIITYATCEGEEAKYASSARKLALVYKLEGGGTICISN